MIGKIPVQCCLQFLGYANLLVNLEKFSVRLLLLFMFYVVDEFICSLVVDDVGVRSPRFGF